jgi:hypothetical protein
VNEWNKNRFCRSILEICEKKSLKLKAKNEASMGEEN